MNGNYLIPANSKKSLKIFGLFRPFDLALFASGVGISLLLMVVLNVSDFKVAMIAIAPGAIAGLLVFPVPNYHNVLIALRELWIFVTNRQKFVWKGWCVLDECKKPHSAETSCL